MASTTENDLLKMMVIVRDELTAIIMKHQVRDFLEMELSDTNTDNLIHNIAAITPVN